MTDQSLARFTRPHEPDTTELVLRCGECLPGHVVRRAMEALQVVTAYLQDSTGSFVSVRPQPALAREAITEYLEKLLNIEVPGRSEHEKRATDATDFKLTDQMVAIAARFTPPTANFTLLPGEAKHGVHNAGSGIINVVVPQPDMPIGQETVTITDPTGVYSSPREQVKPTRRFDKEGAPY